VSEHDCRGTGAMDMHVVAGSNTHREGPGGLSTSNCFTKIRAG
jgi:hypothetical protein